MGSTMRRSSGVLLLGMLGSVLACSREPDRPVATLRGVDASGAPFELTEVGRQALTLNPVTTKRGGADRLVIELEQVAALRRQGGLKVTTVELRSGSHVSGLAVGAVDGRGADGPQAIDWSDVAEAELSWNRPLDAFQAPPGIWAEIHGDGIDELTLYELEVEESWIVRHGTHAYRRDTKLTDVLPLTVPREQVTGSEWDIPLSWIDRIDIYSAEIEVIVKDPGGDSFDLNGRLGSALRRYNGEATFQGTDEAGRWTISIDRIQRAVRQVSAGRPGSPEAARVVIELHGQDAAARASVSPPQAVGACTTWEGESYPVVAIWLEAMTLRSKGGSELVISPGELQSLTVYKNPWTAYDQRQNVPQWLQAELVTRDGSRATGELGDRFGYVSCLAPEGLIVHFPSYALRSLAFGEPPGN
jgi:hypothetical protein